jgi:hypothetical protein
MKKNEKLLEFKDRYQEALSAYGGTRDKFDDRWQQYKGTKQIKDKYGNLVKDADIVWNFTYELIESQVDSFIPPPKVKPQRVNEKTLELASIIEDMCRNEIDRMPMEYINDEDERVVKVMGGDLFLIEWDNAMSTHDTVGALSLRLINAKQFIPQKGVVALTYMDHIFITFEDTKVRIKERYNKDVELESVDGQTTDTTDKEDMVTQVICYYMKNGRLGCFSWAGDTVLIDDADYEARKDKICSHCGKTKPLGENQCVCGSKEWERRPLDSETLTEDIARTDGSVIPSMDWAMQDGKPLLEDYERQEIDMQTGLPVYDYVFNEQMMPVGEQPRMVTDQRPYKVPTQIPYYTPKKFPICLRKNVSVYGEVMGDSDCDVIKDFQVATNKLLSKVNKKAINAGSVLAVPAELNYTPSDEDVKPILITDPSQINMLKSITLDYNITQDLDTIERYYQMAKSSLGITDTFQGKPDPTASSGTAKSIQLAQAAGRQKSKRVMKNAVYADIYEMMFKFMLAYADEPRVYISTDQNGKPVEKVFNRYDFLEQDEYGNWYYNDEFLFSVDEAGATYSDRNFILEDIRTDFGNGAFGNSADPSTLLLYWKEKEVLNYPNAKRMVQYFENKVNEAQQQAQQMQQQQTQQAPQQKTPSETIAFKDLPPEGKIQMAAHAGIQLSPQDVIQPMPADIQPMQGGVPNVLPTM